jgi:hypothetical protein
MATKDIGDFLQKLKEKMEDMIRIIDDAAREIPGGRQTGLNGRKRIPDDLTEDDFANIRKLLEDVRRETGAEIVNMRLNKSDTERSAPVFVGWVESQRVRGLRLSRNEPDPGFSRLGDTVIAREYTETLNAYGEIVRRDWSAALSSGRATLSEKSPEQKALVPRAGLMYQLLVGIIVDGHSVGTLNLAFPRKPSSDEEKKAEEAIKRWAGSKQSRLIEFLKDRFVLGGPARSVSSE